MPLIKTWLKSLLWVSLLVSAEAHAILDDTRVLDKVLDDYITAIGTWGTIFVDSATWIYWLLVTISMVITFGFMALRKADLSEFFAEFVRFILFVGFFWWLLINGPNFAKDIMDSLRSIGGTATGLGPGMSPSTIMDIGFDVLDKATDSVSGWKPIDGAVTVLIGLAVLIVTALVAINMLLLLISGYILATAGVFFLGFGGSKWTSDMAINYYKSVLGLGAQLMAMILIVGVGSTIMTGYVAQLSVSVSYEELAVMLVSAVALLILSNQVPALIAGIITGSAVGGQGIGQFGAGAAMGAAATAVAAAATAGAALAGAAAATSGGVSALMAAFSEAQTNVSEGTDIASGFGGESNDADLDFAESSGMESTDSPAGDEGEAGMGGSGSDGSSGDSSDGSDGSSGDSSDGSDGSNGDSSEASSSTSETVDRGGSGGSEGGSENSEAVQRTGGDSGSDSASGGSKLQKAARIAADTVANLASGIAASSKEGAQARVASTTGGKLAETIKASGEAKRSDAAVNSISGEGLSDASKKEIDAFVDKK